MMGIEQSEDGWFDHSTQRLPPVKTTKPHTGQLTTAAPAPLVETARVESRCTGPDHDAVAQGSTPMNSVTPLNSIPTTVVPAAAPVKTAQIKPQHTGPDHDSATRGTPPGSIPDGTVSQPTTASVVAPVPAPVETAQIKPQRIGPDYDAVARGSTPSLNVNEALVCPAVG